MPLLNSRCRWSVLALPLRPTQPNWPPRLEHHAGTHRHHRRSRRADQIDAAMHAPGVTVTRITPAKGRDFLGPAGQGISQPGPRHGAPSLGHRCGRASAKLRHTTEGGRSQVGHHRGGRRGGSNRVALFGSVGSSRWHRQPCQPHPSPNPDQAEKSASVEKHQGPGGAKAR